MVSKVVTVVNEQGIHMRPAGIISKAVAGFKGCNVTMEANGKTIKAKAIMQIMAAGIKKGCEVNIICDGEGEEAALQELVTLFESGFGE